MNPMSNRLLNLNLLPFLVAHLSNEFELMRLWSISSANIISSQLEPVPRFQIFPTACFNSDFNWIFSYSFNQTIPSQKRNNHPNVSSPICQRKQRFRSNYSSRLFHHPRLDGYPVAPQGGKNFVDVVKISSSNIPHKARCPYHQAPGRRRRHRRPLVKVVGGKRKRPGSENEMMCHD